MRTSLITQERSKSDEILVAFNSHITGYPWLRSVHCTVHINTTAKPSQSLAVNRNRTHKRAC